MASSCPRREGPGSWKPAVFNTALLVNASGVSTPAEARRHVQRHGEHFCYHDGANKLAGYGGHLAIKTIETWPFVLVGPKN